MSTGEMQLSTSTPFASNPKFVGFVRWLDIQASRTSIEHGARGLLFEVAMGGVETLSAETSALPL